MTLEFGVAKPTGHTGTQRRSKVKLAHLFEGSHGSAELVEQADGDAEHGGEGQTPTDHLPPPRVHILIVVGKRLVINQVKQEDALRGEEKAWT